MTRMPRELATSRRVRKGLLPGMTADARSAAPESVAETTAPLPGSALGERVVADVRHEIGNYFHKLYYWTDFLTESRAGRGSDVTATQMLEETIRGLEELMRATLEYVRPIAVVPIRMPANEVADGIVRQLTSALAGRPVAVATPGDLGARVVSLDPGRLSQVLHAIVRRLDGVLPTDARLDVTVGIERVDGAEALAIATTIPALPAPRSTLAEVEWATAEQVTLALGGELVVRDGGAVATVTLVLPLRT
jgi:hypothetical protein